MQSEESPEAEQPATKPIPGSPGLPSETQPGPRPEDGLHGAAGRPAGGVDYRSLVEQLGEGVAVLDGELAIEFANPAAGHILGVAAGGLAGRSLLEFVAADAAGRVRAQTAICRLAPGSSYELPIVRGDGQARTLLVTGTPEPEAPGQQARVIAVMRDITERKETERKLRESEACYRQLIEMSPDAVVVHQGTQVALINNTGARLMGATDPAQLIGKSLMEAVHPDSRMAVGQRIMEVMMGKPARPMEEKILRLDGRVADAEIAAAPIMYQGKPAVLVLARDITARKRTEAEREAALAALRESEEKYRQLFDSELDAIFLVDTGNGQILEANAAAESTYGYTREELLEREYFNISAEPLAASRAMGEAEARVPLRWHRRKDGTHFPVEIAASRFEWRGRPVQIVAVRDISERKRTDDLLAERERQQAAAAELGQRALRNGDLAGLFAETAAVVARTLEADYCAVLELAEDRGSLLLRGGAGWPAELVGRVHMGAGAGSEARYTLRAAEPVVMEDVATETRFGDLSLLRQMGIASGIGVTIAGEQGPYGILAAHTRQRRTFSAEERRFLQAVANVLAAAIARRRIEEDLRRRAQEKAALYETSLEIRARRDLSSLLNKITERAAGLLGTCTGALFLARDGGTSLQLVAGHNLPEHLLNVLVAAGRDIPGRVLATGQPMMVPDYQAWEGHARSVEGLGWRRVLAVPLKTGNGLVGVLGFVDSERAGEFSADEVQLAGLFANQAAIAIENAQLYAEAQGHAEELEQRVADRTADLQIANAELKRMARYKDEFLAVMSHELRTPLNIILNICESLCEGTYGSLNERQIQHLVTQGESGRQLLALINDILDISKIEAGKNELTIDPVNVEGLCGSCLRLVQEMALKKRLRVRSAWDPQVETIQADGRRLKQILVNLLSNAVKFTPEGGSIGLEVTADPARRLVNFVVWDTGIGIEREKLTQVFEPFVQVDSSLSRQYEGTGLGLALVDRLTRLHGGSVSVESEPGRGSRFTVTLPWRDGDAAGEPPELVDGGVWQAVETMAGREGAPAGGEAASCPLILLAEDNAVNAEAMSDYLEVKGYRVVLAHNGLQAVDLATSCRPDVILMDVQMPGMDGLRATQIIRGDPALAQTPIVALTGLAMPGDAERCVEAGATGYLSKPVKLDELVRTIEAQVGR